MHQFIVNATIQVIPLAQDRHHYEWVDIAIPIIQSSGIKYEIRSFATEIEGTYDQILMVFSEVNNHLNAQNCPEWITNLQVQIRSKGDIKIDEKISKYAK